MMRLRAAAAAVRLVPLPLQGWRQVVLMLWLAVKIIRWLLLLCMLLLRLLLRLLRWLLPTVNRV